MRKKSITALSLTLAAGALLSCQSGDEQQGQQLVLKNQSSIALTDKAIAVKREDFKFIPTGKPFPLLMNSQGDTIPAQLDDLDGDEQWDELFFVTDLAPEEEQELQLSWLDSNPDYPARTTVRFGKRSAKDSPVQPAESDTLYADGLPKSIGYQPYQTDGPSWENDKVGFRHYFDGRNAKDVFGKKVSYMSPENVGINEAGAVEDNYHVMEAWGRDILAVGNSAGLGGIALLIDDQPSRIGVTVNDSINNVEKTTFKILSKGPVRSVMHFGYHNWQAGGRNYSIEENTSIWPGMYAYHNSASVSGLQGDEALLIGLVNINTDQPPTEIEVNDEWIVLLTHDQQTYEKEWWLGMALILPRDAYQGYIQAPESGPLSHSYFGKMKIENDQPLSYFAVAGWELSDEGFKDPAYFRNYVQDLTAQITAKVDVQVR